MQVPVGEAALLDVAAGQHLFHAHQQFQDVKGLHQIVLRPQAQAGNPAHHVGLGADENDGNVLFLQVGQQFKAVQLRHHDVQQGQVKLLALGSQQGLPAILAAADLIARHLQVGFQQAQDGRVVLRNQHTGFHGFTSGRL